MKLTSQTGPSTDLVALKERISLDPMPIRAQWEIASFTPGSDSRIPSPPGRTELYIFAVLEYSPADFAVISTTLKPRMLLGTETYSDFVRPWYPKCARDAWESTADTNRVTRRHESYNTKAFDSSRYRNGAAYMCGTNSIVLTISTG